MDRKEQMLQLIKYIVNIKGQRISSDSLKEIVITNLRYCENFSDDIYTKIIKYLYENSKNIPSIKDIKEAYEDIFYKKTEQNYLSENNEVKKDETENYFIPNEISFLKKQIILFFTELINKNLSQNEINKIFYETGVLIWYGENIVNEMGYERYKNANTTKEYNKEYEFNFEKFMNRLKRYQEFISAENLNEIKRGYDNGEKEYQNIIKETDENLIQEEPMPELEKDNDIDDLLDDIEIPF